MLTPAINTKPLTATLAVASLLTLLTACGGGTANPLSTSAPVAIDAPNEALTEAPAAAPAVAAASAVTPAVTPAVTTTSAKPCLPGTPLYAASAVKPVTPKGTRLHETCKWDEVRSIPVGKKFDLKKDATNGGQLPLNCFVSDDKCFDDSVRNGTAKIIETDLRLHSQVIA